MLDSGCDYYPEKRASLVPGILLLASKTKGTMYTLIISFKKKRIRDPLLVIGRTPSVAHVSSLRSKRFCSVSERELKTSRKMERVKERGEWGGKKKVDLWSL